MALLTAAEMMEFVETDRSDEVLTVLIAAAESAINQAAGPVDSITSTTLFEDSSLVNPQLIYVDRPIGTIASVTETSGDAVVILDATDYELLYGGRAIRRLYTGTNSQSVWARRVDILYAPADDLAERILVCAQLVELALHFTGAKSVSAGNVSETAYDDYTRQRADILAVLTRGLAIS